MPTTGYIQLQFNATYLGDYRVCWRAGTVGPRTCFTVNCGSLGLCTVYITPVSFPTDTCNGTINYNGYVQASCEDPNDTEGAVFWNIDYDVVTDCNPWEITCLGVTTLGSFDLDITASGALAFNVANIGGSSAGRECLCSLNPKWNAVGTLLTPQPGGVSCSTYNTDLQISPWGSSAINIQAWDSANQTAGNYHWNPGTLFCGRFEGGGVFTTGIGNTSCDACGYYNSIIASNSAAFGLHCIYKPIISISAPPPGGTQAVAEAIMGLGGIPTNVPITVVTPGTGGVDGTYYAWNASTNLAQAPGSLLKPRGKGYFKVEVVGNKIASVTPCNTLLCQPGGTPARGFYFSSQAEDIIFNPADIGGVVGGLCQKPAGPLTSDWGYIIGVEIINPGSGYLAPPVVNVITTGYTCSTALNGIVYDVDVSTTPGGTGPCPPFTPGEGCGTYPGNVSPTIPALPVGTTFNLCYPSNSETPPWTLDENDWQINTDPNECCYDCVDIFVQSTPANPTPQLVYTDFSTQNVTVFTMTSGTAAIAGVVNSSWASTSSDTIFTITGPCTL
jgi:hypothetical protein